ncbi:MAG: hypothetical protein P3W91_003030 [Fervidobacterium sp.]|nr:hypothetical protein [Fervidobacterium sp.]
MFFAMLVGPSKVRMYSQDKEYELHGDVFISHAEEPEFKDGALIIKPAKTFNLWIRQVKYRPTIREDFFKCDRIEVYPDNSQPSGSAAFVLIDCTRKELEFTSEKELICTLKYVGSAADR